jgi:hypothetical protein
VVDLAQRRVDVVGNEETKGGSHYAGSPRPEGKPPPVYRPTTIFVALFAVFVLAAAARLVRLDAAPSCTAPPHAA